MQKKFFLVMRSGFIYMNKCVYKITGITVTEKQSECLRAAVVQRGGGSASQGRMRQPSAAARSIWMTLYIMET